MTRAHAQVTVVGTGNWLVSHDRVGPRVLELLDGCFGPEVDLCPTGTGGLALLDHLNRQDLLLLVDACTLGGPPGTLRVVEDPDPEQIPSGVATMHQIGPLEALAVAHHLYSDDLPRQIALVLVETEGIDEDQLERACQDAASYVNKRIRRALAEPDREASAPQA